MLFYASIGVIIVLSLVHLTVHRWRILQGPNGHVWLSISSGTALAYVFTFLLPKLASVQATLQGSGDAEQTFVRNHAYLLTLAGLLTYFAIRELDEKSLEEGASGLRLRAVVLIQLIAYSFYSFQLGFLVADLPQPDLISYELVALILGLHLMGINYYICKAHPREYQG